MVGVRQVRIDARLGRGRVYLRGEEAGKMITIGAFKRSSRLRRDPAGTVMAVTAAAAIWIAVVGVLLVVGLLLTGGFR